MNKCTQGVICLHISGGSYSLNKDTRFLFAFGVPSDELRLNFGLPPYVFALVPSATACGLACGRSQRGRWWIIQTSGQISSGSPLRLDSVESAGGPSEQTAANRWVIWHRRAARTPPRLSHWHLPSPAFLPSYSFFSHCLNAEFSVFLGFCFSDHGCDLKRN